MSQITEKASHTKKLNQVHYLGLASCRLWRNVTKARKIGFLKIASFEWGRHSRRHAFTSFERMRVFLVFMEILRLFFICSLDVYQQRTSPHLYDYLKIAEFPHLSNIRQPV